MPLTATILGGVFGVTATLFVNFVQRLPLYSRPWEHVVSGTVGVVLANAWVHHSRRVRADHFAIIADYERRQLEYAQATGAAAGGDKHH